MAKNKVLIICGATGVGKTALALKIAKKFNGDLLVADSRMVYKGMDIVTGKDIPQNSKFIIQNSKLRFWETEGGIRIWLTDLVDPKNEFSVSQWRKTAWQVIDNLWKEGKLPIIVGGTGLYIRSLTNTLETINVPQNKNVRKLYSDKTPGELFEILSQLDSLRAGGMNTSDKKNPRRLIRAIEVVLQKQKATLRQNSGQASRKQKTLADFLKVGLMLPKEVLFGKIRKRVGERIENGALSEVEQLLREGVGWDNQSMTAIGYRELKDYFQKKKGLDQAVEDWVKAEQKYAKKQTVWFKKEKDIRWFSADSPNLGDQVEKVVENWYNKFSDSVREE